MVFCHVWGLDIVHIIGTVLKTATEELQTKQVGRGEAYIRQGARDVVNLVM